VYTFGCRSAAHFALYFPFSYSDCQRLLRNIDHALGSEPSTAASAARIRAGAPPPGGSSGSRARLRAKLRNTGDPSADIYYHRELLALSPEGRRVELLSISSCAGRLSERLPHIEGLFPERGPRPHRFKGKPVVYVGARVHPGETAASYMLHGLLAFLLQPRNPYARALRNRFVFLVVPMLNPDGVARGHFRADAFGLNLNRQYAAPSLSKQPAIYGVRAVLKQAASLFSPVPLESSGRAGGAAVFAFIDLHGFTSRHGCYVIGNSLPPHKESRSLMLAQLIQLYTPQFNANACSFGKGRRGAGPKRGHYATPFGQMVPTTLVPEAGEGAGTAHLRPASRSPEAEDGSEAASAVGGVGAGEDDDEDGAGPGDEDNDDEDDDEDGADAMATPRSEGEEDEEAAALADDERRRGRASPPLVDERWLRHECYPGELARLHDPFSAAPLALGPGERAGPATARLSDGEASRVSREWVAMKARMPGRGEGAKEGTGRACALRDFGVPHCYTVECSCNLLPHRRVYDRVHAAAHLHHCDASGHHASAHGDVDPAALDPGPADEAGRGAAAGRSRVARVARRKVVTCQRCSGPLTSQLGPERARELRDAVVSGLPEAAAALALGPVSGYSPRHPYACQVDSLQPPPGCSDYSPPFGFAVSPPRADEAACAWGTCAADPPSVFASVGRGLALALLDVSGGSRGLFSRVTRSQWGSLDALGRWARSCTSAAYGIVDISRSGQRAAPSAAEAGMEAAAAAAAEAAEAIASGLVAASPPVARKRRPRGAEAAPPAPAALSLRSRTSSGAADQGPSAPSPRQTAGAAGAGVTAAGTAPPPHRAEAPPRPAPSPFPSRPASISRPARFAPADAERHRPASGSASQPRPADGQSPGRSSTLRRMAADGASRGARRQAPTQRGFLLPARPAGLTRAQSHDAAPDTAAEQATPYRVLASSSALGVATRARTDTAPHPPAPAFRVTGSHHRRRREGAPAATQLSPVPLSPARGFDVDMSDPSAPAPYAMLRLPAAAAPAADGGASAASSPGGSPSRRAALTVRSGGSDAPEDLRTGSAPSRQRGAAARAGPVPVAPRLISTGIAGYSLLGRRGAAPGPLPLSRGSALRVAGISSVSSRGLDGVAGAPAPEPAPALHPRAREEAQSSASASAGAAVVPGGAGMGEEAIERFLRELAALEAEVDQGTAGDNGDAAQGSRLRRKALAPSKSARRKPARPAAAGRGAGPAPNTKRRTSAGGRRAGAAAVRAAVSTARTSRLARVGGWGRKV